MEYSDKLFLFLFFGVLIFCCIVLVFKITSYKKETNQPNISAYQEEQKQIYEAKLKRRKKNE